MKCWKIQNRFIKKQLLGWVGCMQRDVVNLFIDDTIFNKLKEIQKKENVSSIDININNSFGAKVTLLHLNETYVKNNGINKVALSHINDKKIQGKVISIYNNVVFEFSFEKKGVKDHNEISLSHLPTDEHRFYAKSFIMYCVGIISLINNGHLGASDSLNRKEKRFIKKNNILKDDKEIDDFYKIISLHKKYHHQKTDNTTDIRQREHMRRGHYRHYKATGKIVWINAYKAGDASLGTIVKDYKV